MIGLSVLDQLQELVATLNSYRASAAGSSPSFCVGIETERPKWVLAGALEAIRAQGWDACCVWDSEIDARVRKMPGTKLVSPFLHGFSYGAVMNRLLLLAAASDCDYLLRIDPGTECASGLGEMAGMHLAARERGMEATSGQYTNRLGLRDDFVRPVERARYYALVREATGMDCRPGRQLTAGAGMFMSSQGPPAIPFEDVGVWASDDGFQQLFRGGGKTEVLDEIKVGRANPGILLDCNRYLARVAAAVVLRGAHEGRTRESALADARGFLYEVEKFLASGINYAPDEAVRAISSQVDAVYCGYDNYLRLIEEWPAISDRFAGSVDRKKLLAWG